MIIHLRNKFHFSEVHQSMNAMGYMQGKWCLKGVMLTWHETHCVHSLMNIRKKWNSSLIYTLCFYIVFAHHLWIFRAINNIEYFPSLGQYSQDWCNNFNIWTLPCLISGWFKEGIFLHFCASMISGLVTTAASMPVDIAKTRYVRSSVSTHFAKGRVCIEFWKL